MAGSLRLIRDADVWELRVFVGRDSQGRVRHMQRSFRGSRRAAEEELAKLVAEQANEPVAAPEEPIRWGPTTTVNDAIATWRRDGMARPVAEDSARLRVDLDAVYRAVDRALERGSAPARRSLQPLHSVSPPGGQIADSLCRPSRRVIRHLIRLTPQPQPLPKPV
jgi:hypothetical protein